MKASDDEAFPMKASDDTLTWIPEPRGVTRA